MLLVSSFMSRLKTAHKMWYWLTGLVVFGTVFKLYWKLSTKWCHCYVCLSGKTAIVTGANSGLGYITALDLAKRGCRVIIACRDKEKCQNTVQQIIKATDNRNIIGKSLDLASFDSVRNFAKDINDTEARLDILINNAGAYTHDALTLRVNHVSVFLLTHLLLGKLKRSAPSRIVNVGSYAGGYVYLHPGNVASLREEPKFDFLGYFFLPSAYRLSKLCNLLFTIELARKLQGTGVTVNTLHPGTVQTGLFREIKGVNHLIKTQLTKFFLLTPEEGAQTQIHLAVAKELENVSGAMFTNCTRHEFYRNARDPEVIRRVWEISEELAGLEDHEKI